jgi:hypothetical protein
LQEALNLRLKEPLIKFSFSRNLPSWAKQAAEKLGISWISEDNLPSAAKAEIIYESLTAQLKPRPFKTMAIMEFFRSLFSHNGVTGPMRWPWVNL